MTKRMDLPGPLGKAWIERDRQHLSPSYTRPYPFVMDRGQGAEAWDLEFWQNMTPEERAAAGVTDRGPRQGPPVGALP